MSEAIKVSSWNARNENLVTDADTLADAVFSATLDIEEYGYESSFIHVGDDTEYVANVWAGKITGWEPELPSNLPGDLEYGLGRLQEKVEAEGRTLENLFERLSYLTIDRLRQFKENHDHTVITLRNAIEVIESATNVTVPTLRQRVIEAKNPNTGESVSATIYERKGVTE